MDVRFIRGERGGRSMIDAAVRKRFDQFSLDATMSEGGFTCLAGKNGSGKTTFLKIIAGLIKPDGGYVKVDGRDVTGFPIERRRVVMVTPGSSIPTLQVDGHLRWGAKLKGVEVGEEKLKSVKEKLGIDFHGHVGKLSLGMRERVSLATALLSSPAGILVDEAFANLHGREDFISTYRKLAADAGIDVVFSTQDDSDGRLAQHLYTMEEGRTTRRF
jgi:molybdate/tungstate transport system ATP-binding protein